MSLFPFIPSNGRGWGGRNLVKEKKSKSGVQSYFIIIHTSFKWLLALPPNTSFSFATNAKKPGGGNFTELLTHD